MDLDTQIRTLALSLGADYVGVADLGPAAAFISAQGGDALTTYPRAVVMGIVLLDTLVDLLDKQDPVGKGLYKHNSYDVVNTALDQMANRVASTIQRAGYRALPVPASKRASDTTISGIFSQKLGAHLAGLGWIGKSCLLITPDHGPRVRWVSVLTDAPLTPTGTPMAEQCGACTACEQVCPPHAITGRPFSEDEPREARLDAAACDRYFKEQEMLIGTPVCGMCLYICPHGRRSGSKKEEC
jgi:epoxyqueuosine reductase